LAFALNRIGTPVEEAEARAYIEEAGYVVLVRIPGEVGH